MYNPFSYLFLPLEKWRGGTRLLVLKATGALLAFFVCVYFIFQFAQVQTMENYLQVKKLDRTTGMKHVERPDTFSLKFINYYTSTSDVLLSVGGVVTHLSMHEDTTATILHDKHTDAVIDSILKTLPDSTRRQMQMEHWRDSLCLLYQLQSSINVMPLPFYTPLFYEDTIGAASYGQRFYNMPQSTSLVFSNDQLRLKNEDNDILCYLKGFHRKGSFTIKNTFNFQHDYQFFFQKGDLSQSYYVLKFPHEEKDSAGYYDITRLEIDFSGATRFIGLNPVPDETTLTSICYTDSAKLREIFSRDELRFFCQFAETSNIQGVRTYLVSTIATFFFGVFLRLLFSIVCRLRPLPPLRRGWHRLTRRLRRWSRCIRAAGSRPSDS